MASGFIKVSYQNNSGQAVPPYGVIQLAGSPVTNANTGIVSCQAVQPNGGTGPYLIDDGKGTGVSGPSSYGTGIIPLDGATWVLLDDMSPPPAWATIGPKPGKFGMSSTGTGYWYVGVYDATNQRILVIEQVGGGGSPRIHFNIISIVYGTTNVVTASIIDVTCQLTPPGIDSYGHVTLYDTCWLSPPMSGYQDANIGRQGWADWMSPYGTGYNACRWVISSMCPCGSIQVVTNVTCDPTNGLVVTFGEAEAVC